MKLQGTDFRLARTSGDYRKCHQLVRNLNVDNKTFSFPTILAERDGELIGLMGTIPVNGAIVAGPLVVKVDGNPGPVMIRLVEAYDNLLRGIGVKCYLFFLFPKDKRQREMVERALDTPPLKVENGKIWYRRDVV